MSNTSQTPVRQGATDIITIAYGKRLSDYIKHLPFGKIDKSIPNIGATHMELTDLSRNSIIVFPTRSLAATKAHEHKIHYIGGKFQGMQPSNANKILHELKAGKRVKIAAVADSFIKLNDELKTEFQTYSFFLMMDEIDSFQTESSYRPKLEECLDIYFKFPIDRRCLVSATLEAFSNTDLNDERLTKIAVKNYEKPPLKVIYAPDSVLKVAAEQIKELFQPGYKIFIAFNSIEGILKVLQLLPPEIRQESGILCSEQSHKKIKPYPASQINEGLLQDRVTFFTSAYFVGIDIKEPRYTVHSLIVADTSLSTSLISVAKIRQVFGRVRNKSKSHTLILNNDSNRFNNTAWFEIMLRSRKEAYENVLKTINAEFGKLNLHHEAKAIKKTMLDSCTINNVELLREKNGEVVISNLNLDYLRIQNSSFKRLYVDIRNSMNALNLYFDVNRLTAHSSLSKEENDKVHAVETELRDMKLRDALEVLRNNISDANIVEGTFNKIQCKVWELAKPPIDVNKIKAKVLPIIENGQKVKELNKVLVGVRVFSQDYESAFWKLIALYFVVGAAYSVEYIHTNLDKVIMIQGNDNPFSKCHTPIQSIQKLNLIFETKKKLNKATGMRELLLVRTHRDEYCN